MIEKTINGKVYRIGKMLPRVQLHVARRIAPIMWALFGASLMERGLANMGELDGVRVLGTLSPVLTGLSAMNDADVDYVMNATLGVVLVQQGAAWAAIMTPKGDMMFQDMELQDMMELAAAVIQDNLGNFTAGLLEKLGKAPETGPQASAS